MTHLWDQLEGVSLAGEYGLQEWLGSDATGAFFLTAYGADRQRALAKLMTDDPSTGDAQLDRWRKTGRLSHPNLLPLLDCGRARAAGELYLYAIFEYPEDTLAGAVQNGPLSEADTRDILLAALDALRYLHSEGMVHHSMDADHVVAVGDRIKLGSDSLRDVGESEAGYAGDIYGLGALLYQLLTGHQIDPEYRTDLSGISEPLRSIIEHCIDENPETRWTLDDISQALEPPAAVQEAPHMVEAHEEAQVVPVPLAARDAEPYRAPVEPRRTAYEPFTQPESRPRAFQVHDEPEPSEGVPLARYVPHAAVVLVALVAGVWVIVSHSKPVPAAVPLVPPPAPAAVSAPPPTPVPQTPAHAATAPVHTPKPSPFNPQQAGASAANWRVIAYTYSRLQDAEKKAEHINSKYAGLQAEVFKPQSRKMTAYLVALGGHMTREEAQAMQRKAVARGMPRDTFIQNYSN